jgi:hypothetical protein
MVQIVVVVIGVIGAIGYGFYEVTNEQKERRSTILGRGSRKNESQFSHTF